MLAAKSANWKNVSQLADKSITTQVMLLQSTEKAAGLEKDRTTT
jgi:hypothetical protein